MDSFGGGGAGGLGSASGEIRLDASGALSALDAVGSGLRNLDSQSAGFGSGWAHAIQQHEQQITSWGKGLLGFGAIVTGALGAPIIAGSKAVWGQVDAVEQATFALRAYEKDASKVDAVLADLLAYAKSDISGGLFWSQDLFAAAQGLKVYGAETENLSEYVQIMSRSVGIGTGNWDELNRVIGRVGATGRLTGDDFDMLTKMGYRLDESIRNTDITWEQLFDHLDRGIPADALAGQSDTIRGRMLWLQGALQDVGAAFLGVDRDTGTFIEGGLGDSLFNGLKQARAALLAMVPAVEVFGRAVASIGRVVGRLIDLMVGLPAPVQKVMGVVAGLTGILSMAGGAFLLLLPRISRTWLALQNLGGVTGVIQRLGVALRALTLTNPLFWVLAAAVGAFLAYRSNFLGFRDGVNAVVEAIKNLEIVKQVTEWVQGLSDAFGSFFGAFGRKDISQKVDIEVGGDDKVLERIENLDAADGFDYFVRLKNPDGSLGEFGQIMESYTDEDDPNIAHIKVQTDDGEYWTTIDNTTGEIGTGTIEIEADTKDARRNIKRLNDGLNAVDRTLRKRGMDRLADGLESIREFAGEVGNRFRDLRYNFDQFRNAGVGPVTSALYSLGAVFPSLEGVIRPLVGIVASLSDAFDHVTDALGSFFQGEWEDGFENLKLAAEDAWDAITQAFDIGLDLIMAAFDAVDWAGLWDFLRDTGSIIVDRLGDVASALWDWFVGVVTGIDWGGILSSAWDVLSGAGSWIAGKLGEAWAFIRDWFTEQVGRVSWGDAFQTGIDALASAGQWIYQKLGDAYENIKTWFALQLSKVGWSEVFNDSLAGLQGAGQAIVDALDSVDWSGITTSIGDLADELMRIPLVGWMAAGALDGVGLAIGIIQTAWEAGAATWTAINDWLSDVDTNASSASDSLNTLGGEVNSQTPWWAELGREIGKVLAAAWLLATGITLVLAPFKALVSTIRGLLGPMATAGSWLSRLHPLFIALAVAIGVGVVVWEALERNILGFRDASEKAWDMLNKIAIVIELTANKVMEAYEAWLIFKDAVEAAFDIGEMVLIEHLNSVIDQINGVITQLNALVIIISDLTGIDVPKFEWLDQIKTDADNATLSFNNLGKAIANIGASMAGATLGMGLDIQEASKLPFAGGNLSETGNVQKGMSGITSMLSDLRSQADQTTASLSRFVGQTIGLMGGWSTGIQTQVNSAMDTLKSRASGGTAAGLASFTSFVSQTIGVMGGWSTGVSNQVSRAMDTLQSRIRSGTDSGRSAFQSFTSNVQSMMSSWGSRVTSIVNSTMQNMVSRAQSGGQQLASAMRSGANDAASAVQSALGRIPGIVASVGGAAASAAYSVGANIGNSMAAGMRSALGAISAAANQMVAEADRAVRARARIASPSKLFAQLGEYVGEGFEQGIRSMFGAIARASEQMVHIPDTGRMAPEYAYAGMQGAGNTHVITNTYVYAVSSDEWVAMVRQVEDMPQTVTSMQAAALNDSMAGRR